jgi:hypothetical protein
MSKDLFAGRYEFLNEAPPGSGGRLFEARDTQTGALVAVKVFHRQLAVQTGEGEDLAKAFAAVQPFAHPQVVRHFTLALEDGYLVREWLHGFSLVDLLRRRRELPAHELRRLLEGIPEAIDAAVAAGIVPGDVLTRLFVAWDRSLTQDELQRLRGVPVPEWRDFTVKLNPLSLHLLLPADDATQSTMAGYRPKSALVLGSPPVALADMIYEMLGAPRRVGRNPRYIPLGTLNEAGNAVLRRVLEGQAVPETCAALWAELCREIELRSPTASPLPARSETQIPTQTAPPPLPPRAPAPPPAPPVRELRIPEAFLGAVQAGTVLRFTPRDVTYTPLHFIARPVFRIGRSLYHADFIARVLPETADNARLSNELGRVHTIAELREGRLWLRDGNGEQASVNGSSFNEVKLHDKNGLPLEQPGLLALYRNYLLEVVPMHGSQDGGITIVNEAGWPGPDEPAPPVKGAVVFLPKRNQPMLRQAAWLFTRLDFSLSPRGDVTWCEAGRPENHGAILQHRGQFWIANFALPAGSLRVNGSEIGAGEVVPLVAGMAAQLGPGNYVIEVQ